MTTRKPVQSSMVNSEYDPVLPSADHVANRPTEAAQEVEQHANDNETPQTPLNIGRRPVEQLHRKSRASWRTRFIGEKQGSNTTHSPISNEDVLDPAPSYEPLEDHETHFEPLDEHEKRQLGKEFHPPSQLLHLLISGFIKWLITVALSAILIGVIWVYSRNKKTLSHFDKSAYNFLVIGITLALGMNIGSSLKAMASDLKWWVLSLKSRPLKEVDLILRLDSLTAVFKLAFVAPKMAPACFAWILLTLMGQVGLALLGLTYSADSTTNRALITPNGNVTIPDMSTLFSEAASVNVGSLEEQQYAANNFGNIALSFTMNDTNHIPLPGTLWEANSNTIFADADESLYWKYVFIDYNSDELLKAQQSQAYSAITPAIFTNRTVNATWVCDAWPVLEGGNGTSNKITVQIDTSGDRQDIEIPFAGGLDQTTFMTNPSSNACGEDCSIVHAFEATVTESWYYECNVTVSDVHNVTNPKQNIGNPLKKLASQGIALRGYVEIGQPVQDWQYQTYPATSPYGTRHNGVANSMGLKIGQFTIGVIATAAGWNPTWTIPGDQPRIGSQLDVKWKFVALILALTAGIQLVLFVVTAMVSNLVIVKDESPLSTARLLRPIVDRMGSVGTYADGKTIVKLLGDGPMDRVVYSVKHPQKGSLHHLDLGHQKRLRAFPRGNYD